MRTMIIAPFDSTDEDGSAGTSWGVAATGAGTSEFRGDGVKVAVLDTGIDRAHDAFRGVHITEQDFSGDGNGDRNGHGTHCAGIIFGRDVGGTRIGIAPGIADASIGKVLHDDGSGDTDMLFRGLSWAIEQDVDVISMSLDSISPVTSRRCATTAGPWIWRRRRR